MNEWRIYQDAHGEWRWWKFDADGNIVQASESGFASREDCENDAVIYGYSILKPGLNTGHAE